MKKILLLFILLVVNLTTINAQCNVSYGFTNIDNISYCSPLNPQPITFTVAPSNNPAGFTYQWYYAINRTSCPTSYPDAGMTIIPGATSSTYDPPGGLTQQILYACLVTPVANANCGPGWATGCTQYEPIGNVTYPYGYITQDTIALCPQGDPPNISFVNMPEMNSFSLQWYYKDGVQAAPSGSSTTGWTSISGATATSYNPPTGLAASRTYACYVNAATAVNNCSPAWAARAYVVAVADTSTINYGLIDTTTMTVCAGYTIMSGNLGFLQQPQATTPLTFTYEWYYKEGLANAPTGSSTTGWTLYNPNINPLPMLGNRTYACLVKPSINCANHWANGVKHINIIAPSQINWGTISTLDTIASNTPLPVQFTVPPSGPSVFTYELYKTTTNNECDDIESTPVISFTGPGYSIPSYTPATAGQDFVYKISSNGCGTAQYVCVRRVSFVIPSISTTYYLNSPPYFRNICKAEDYPIELYSGVVDSGTVQWYYKNGFQTRPQYTDNTDGWTLIPGANEGTYIAPAGSTVGERTYACYSNFSFPNCCPTPQHWLTPSWYIGAGMTTDVYGTITGTQTVTNQDDLVPVTFDPMPGPYPLYNQNPNETFKNRIKWFYHGGIAACPDSSYLPNGGGGWSVLYGWTPAPDTWTMTPADISTSGGLEDTITYSAIITPADTLCPSRWANNCAVVINRLNLNNPGVLTGSQYICEGGDPAPITLSSLPTGGSGNYSYQWIRLGGNGCIDEQVLSYNEILNHTSYIIPGATSPTYDPPAGSVTASRAFTCIVRDLNNPYDNMIIPGCHVINITTTPSYGSVSYTGGTIVNACAGAPIQPYTMLTVPTPDGTYTLQWYYKDGAVSTPSTNSTFGWTIVPGATQATLSIGTAPATTRTYCCFVTYNQNPCGISVDANWASGFYRVLVSAPANNGELITTPFTVCPGTPFSLTSSIIYSFAVNPPEGTYQWYYKDGVAAAPTGSSTTGWTLIPGQTTTMFFNSGYLPTATRTYACMVTPSNQWQGCLSPAWANGARVVYVDANVITNPGTIGVQHDTACSGTLPPPVYFNTLPVVTSGTIKYNWYYKAGIVDCPTGDDTFGWTLLGTTTVPACASSLALESSITIACYITVEGINTICRPGKWANGCKKIAMTPMNFTQLLTEDGDLEVIPLCPGGDPGLITPYNINQQNSGVAQTTTTTTYQWYYRDYPYLMSFNNSTQYYNHAASQIMADYTLIPGATGTTYDPPAGLTVNRVYRCVAYSHYANTCNPSGVQQGYFALKGAVAIEVPSESFYTPYYDMPVVYAYNEAICTGDIPHAIHLTNLDTSQTYQWYYKDGLNACPEGGDNTGWTSIAGEETYAYVPTTGITTNRTYACMVSPRKCLPPHWALSCRKVAVGQPVNYGTIVSADVVYCSNATPDSIRFATLPTGATSFTYQWYYQAGTVACPSGSSTIGWTLYSSAGPTVRPGTSNRTYACFVTPIGPDGCAMPGAWASGCRHILPVSNIAPTAQFGAVRGGFLPANVGSTLDLYDEIIASPSGGNGTSYSAYWYYKTGVVACPTGSSTTGWTAMGNSVPNADAATVALYVNVFSCNGTISGWATNCYTVLPANTATYYAGTLAPGNQTVCASELPGLITFSTLPQYYSDSIKFQWMYKEAIVSAPAAGSSTSGWITAVTYMGTPDFYPPADEDSRTYACYVLYYSRVSESWVGRWADGCRQITASPTTVTVNYGTLNSTGETVCFGGDPAPISFATLPSMPMGYSLQWYRGYGACGSSSTNSWELIPGATGPTYDPPAGINVTTQYGCWVSPNQPSCAVVSLSKFATNCWTVTVPSSTANMGSLANTNQTICLGADPAPITFSTPPSGTGYTFTYQWYYKMGTSGTDPLLGAYTLIPGATGSTYDPPPTPYAYIAYFCYVTATPSSPACNTYVPASAFATSYCTVSTATISYGSLVSGNQTVCTGADPNSITFSSTPASSTFQWYYADGNVTPAGNTTGWTIIPGATTTSYDPPTGLTTTRTYACYVTNTVCTPNTSGWASVPRVVTVAGPVSRGTINSTPVNVCSGGNPPGIAFTQAASNPTGTISYQWYYQDGAATCPTGTSTTGWTLINGANNSSYTPTGLTVSRTYACRVNFSNACNAADNTPIWANGCRQYTITPTVDFGSMPSTSQTVCTHVDLPAISLTTLPAGGSNSYTYKWYYKDSLASCPTGNSTTGWTQIAATASSYNPPDQLLYAKTYACLVTASASGGGCPATSGWATGCAQFQSTGNIVTGTVNTTPITTCYDGNAHLTLSTLPTGGNFRYQWESMSTGSVCPSGTSLTTVYTSGINPDTIISGIRNARKYACRIIVDGLSTCPDYSVYANGCIPVTVISDPFNEAAISLANPANSGGETICYGGDPSAITVTPDTSLYLNQVYELYYKDGLYYAPNDTVTNTTGWTFVMSSPTGFTYDPPAGLTTDRTFAVRTLQTGIGICQGQTAQGWSGNVLINVTSNTGTATSLGTIAAGNESVCSPADPANISFATLPTGTQTISYQWYYKDGIVNAPTGTSTTGWTSISGAINSSYNPPAGLTQSRTYACYVSLGQTSCGVTVMGWASQCRQVTVSSGQAANYGTLATGSESYCTSGDPANITFATAPSGGSGNFTYQWYYRDGNIVCPTGTTTTNWTLINGATTTSYDPPAGLTITRTYACMVSVVANGCTATANSWAAQCRTVTISFPPSINYGTLSSGNESFCTTGDPANITFSTAPTGGTFTYQWYYKDSVVACPSGTATTGWSLINGATSISYNPPDGLANSRTYACFVTAAAQVPCPASGAWASQCRQVIVTPPPTVTYGVLATGNETLCSGGDPVDITFGTMPTGGTFTYQWYYQDGLISCPSGSSTTGWTAITGATASSYNPAGLTASRTYACMVTAVAQGACPSSSAWASQCRQVTVSGPAISFGTVASANETFCTSGNPSNITFGTAPTGGTFSYQWYYKDSIVAAPTGNNTTGWTLINGATASAYDPPTVITNSRTYACLVTVAAQGNCPASSAWAAQCRQVTINVVSYGTLASGNENICTFGDPSPISFSTPASGGSGNYTYQWYYRNGAQTCPGALSVGWMPISGATSATYDPPAGLNQTRTYACKVTATAGSGCSASTFWASNCRVVSITQLPTYGTLNAIKRVCMGGDPEPITFSVPPAGGTSYSYQWYYKNGTVTVCPYGSSTAGWTIIPGATASSYNPPGNANTTRTYACLVTSSGTGTCSNGTGWASNCVKALVVPPPTYGALTGGSEQVCSGGNPVATGFLTMPGGYGSFTYQWYYKNGIVGCPTGSSTAGWTAISGATTSSYDPPTGLTQSRTYACLVTNTLTPCNGSQWASNCRKVTVITCRIADIITFEEDENTIETSFERPDISGEQPTLEQNFPNPFSEQTTITCTLPKAYNSSYIKVYNVVGQEMVTKKLSSPGVNRFEITRGTLMPGIYFYSLYLDGKLYDTKRMVITN